MTERAVATVSRRDIIVSFVSSVGLLAILMAMFVTQLPGMHAVLLIAFAAPGMAGALVGIFMRPKGELRTVMPRWSIWVGLSLVLPFFVYYFLTLFDVIEPTIAAALVLFALGLVGAVVQARAMLRFGGPTASAGGLTETTTPTS